MANLYALLGHPVGHSMSPELHNTAFNKLGLPHRYHAFDTAPEHLPAAVAALKTLGVAGWNVTVPHKVAVMDELDEISEDAQAIGAVNTVVNKDGRLIGYNTDGQGYLDSLIDAIGPALRHKRVLIIGAGGAARAVATVLSRYGTAGLFVTNRTAEKAETVAAECASATEIVPVDLETAKREAIDYDLFINTTSVGMSPHIDEVPFPVEAMDENKWVSDLIYNPEKTKWLRESEARGAGVHNGLGMFVRQGALSFELWTGEAPDLQAMTQVVKRRLGGNIDVNKER
ncbi:shikimate dehydrogenase [Salsuginibacillus halophilus]|uniref:Shikimate dehydrogenase (NADP(+)) n=1 Tax=Salsuginibacillus halophilus TaxID=517424 RepID=A0A2P8HFR0_9BACI|nr:shikimate dehydrogenase [Salsuginibacillus halophilus]PSL45057.1 shikimate dehydrogenase [Salsuginibacillus halophilus]